MNTSAIPPPVAPSLGKVDNDILGLDPWDPAADTLAAPNVNIVIDAIA